MSAQDETSKGKGDVKSWIPWSSSATPSNAASESSTAESASRKRQAFDHVVTHRHRLSLKEYPRDCPPLKVQWFHAVDVAKRRPQINTDIKEKQQPKPKKYAAFSKKDSKALEAAYQRLVEEEDTLGHEIVLQQGAALSSHEHTDLGSQRARARNAGKRTHNTVHVNEDYLFDVDVEKRELCPAYWIGPIYDVRRGTWFYQEGTVQKPCDETLAAQLEEGYLKTQAWKLSEDRARSTSLPRSRDRPTSWTPEAASRATMSSGVASKGSHPDLFAEAANDRPATPAGISEDKSDRSYRLFGSHMGSVVTYSSATTAWLSTDDFMSRMNYNVYQRFGGGGHFGGVKLTRGFIDTSKKTDAKSAKPANTPTLNEPSVEKHAPDHGTETRSAAEARRQTLERHMSYLLEDPNAQDPAKQDEEQRLRDEQEIEDDYREVEGDDQGREIEHLILVTHGIGQRLGLRLDSVNFVHDVNMLRKTIKAVYADSPDLRALNAELDNATKINSRIQVLPICWRHLLDFPRQSLKHNRAEHDLADSQAADLDEYPSLADISVEGVPAVRNLISDLALDILLYQSPAYKDHITNIVLTECNRIYNLFRARNPDFLGKVSMIGHSLGSAIMFDIICRQDLNAATSDKHRMGKSGQTRLDFEVFDFYALGSPIGLFEMLNGRGIKARSRDQERRLLNDEMDHTIPRPTPSSKTKPFSAKEEASPLPADTQNSHPQCDQIFNIFHPTDPIAYRIEPLISKAMSSMKPQPLPYTKRGLFGAPVGQGLTGIGARVGQSVSSFWSSMSSGLASSLLTRGLGYVGDEAGKLPGTGGEPDAKTSAPLSLSAGTNVGAGVGPSLTVPSESTPKATDGKQAQLANDTLTASARGQHLPTLIDQDLQTLSTGYEERRQSLVSDNLSRDLGATHTADLAEIEARGKQLRREEEKVRKLNSNGRVDYAIQEGAFDINLLAAIASHLSYWGDEDVSHFMISQLLSRSRFKKRSPSSRKP